jgi:hypothetical protein
MTEVNSMTHQQAKLEKQLQLFFLDVELEENAFWGSPVAQGMGWKPLLKITL